jgi:Bacterial SH3 domain
MKQNLAFAAAFGALALLGLAGQANASSYGSGAQNADQARVSEKISIWEMPRNRANEIIGLLQAGEIVTIQRCTVDGNWCRVISDQPIGWVPASYLVGSPAKADATPLRTLTIPLGDDATAHPRQHNGGGSIF